MRWAIVLVLPAALLGWRAGRGADVIDAQHGLDRPPVDDGSQVGGAVFDRDPDHPWNRLHRLLYSRTTPEGKLYDQESLEPLFLPSSRFLTEGPSYQQGADAAGRVPERSGRRTDQGSGAPRDLAARSLGGLLHDGRGCHAVGSHRRPERSALEYGSIRRPWRCGRTGGTTPPASRAAETSGASHAPDRPPPAEIEPCRTICPGRGVGVFPRTFDPNHPGEAFLPTDLFARDGPWVAVSNAARRHGGIPGRAGACPLHQRQVCVQGLPPPAGRPPGDRSLSEEAARGRHCLSSPKAPRPHYCGGRS